ncbi:MAG: sialate O-acetylesterase [bacterium]|nr:sialate O-acetylesterase [bacterium]
MAPPRVAAAPQDVEKGRGPLKVFVLAGQSNMQGHAHVRTLDVMASDPVTAPILAELVDADGTPRVWEDVWISSIGSADEQQVGALTVGFGAGARGPKIGPELTFGVTMRRLLDEPILIIKTAWGGKSLNTDFRPPSAGPYEFDESQLERFAQQGKDVEAIRAAKVEATGRFYRSMIEHVRSVLADVERIHPYYDADLGYELAGLVWFQGWNDMVDRGTYPRRGETGGYDAYSQVLAHFIRDVRKDLAAPELPFVIGVLGVGGPVERYRQDQQRYKGVHQNFRDAMAAPAALPEFEGTVTAVLTETYWDMMATALRKREGDLKPALKRIEEQRKAGELRPEEARAARAELRAKAFTAEELDYLENSTSNAEFHYLGSAKIMTQIGKAFAEAMSETLPR